MSIGLVIILFVGWQQFLGDQIMGQTQIDSATSQIDALGIPTTAADPDVVLNTTDPPPVVAPVGEHEVLGFIYVPRFGADFVRTIGEGTNDRYVLDSLDMGVAHYGTSQMPGEVGNFALAAHRNGRGGPFTTVDQLQVGDHIYILAGNTWFVYEFRNTEYVEPTAVDVVGPVPQQPTTPPNDRFITLTTCNPIGSIAGRLIGYGVFIGWQPADDGVPTMLVNEQQAAAAGAL